MRQTSIKVFVLCLLTGLFLGSACGQRKTGVNKTVSVSTSTIQKSQSENVTVTIYEDGKEQSVKTFANGVLTKEETEYEIENKKVKGVTKYYYTKDGKIKSTEEWKNGKKVNLKDRDYDFDVNLVAQYLYSTDLLKKKEIVIPLPGLIFSQIKDTANIFDIADNNDGFNKETSTDGDLKTIKFIGFNKNIRFDPTLLDINMDQTITDYELTLKNRLLYKEIFTTGPSELKDIKSAQITRQYTYENNRLMKLVTTSHLDRNDNEPYNSTVELKFVYSN